MSDSLILEIALDPTCTVTPEVMTVEVDRSPFVIGRDRSSCHWVLDNGRNTISRHHANITSVGGAYYLESTGRNPVSVNRTELPSNSPREIRDGDTFTIEEFEIRVRRVSAAAEKDVVEKRAKQLERPLPIPSPPSIPPGSNPFSSITPNVGVRSAPDEEGQEEAESQLKWWEQPSTNSRQIVDDDWSSGRAVSSILDEPGPVVQWSGQFPAAADGVEADDPFVVSTDKEDSSEVRRAPLEPDGAFSTFLKAAGFEGDAGASVRPDELGKALRAAIEGFRKLHKARIQMNRQLRVSSANESSHRNPLKSAEKAGEALELLFASPEAERLDGASAIREIVAEFENHEIAMVASLGRAFENVLESFDPAMIERDVSRKSANPLAALTTKSKCWDQFVAKYGRWAEDRNDAQQRLFLDPLAEAYLKSVAGQRAERRSRSEDRGVKAG